MRAIRAFGRFQNPFYKIKEIPAQLVSEHFYASFLYGLHRSPKLPLPQFHTHFNIDL